MATEDALDALSVLQNIAPLSYDSSRLLDVACIGFGGVQDADLATLRSICRLPVLSHVQVMIDGPALFARQLLKFCSDSIIFSEMSAATSTRVSLNTCQIEACSGL